MVKNGKISDSVRRILANRGIVEDADIEEYMSPTPKRTYDPFLIKGMDEASDMIIKYAAERRKICIYGDYDADGVTSSALMLTLLGELGADAWYYIPSRFEEGYGLNKGAVDKIAAEGTELMITVDNGCVAFDEVAYIREKGMEVIVTDHHNVEEKQPDCIMLNPKQPGDEYPYKYLCGCGVAFKLAQAITRKAGIDKKKLNSLLDVVAVATIGDIVPLTDENRTLVKYGMDRIHRNERVGMKGLLERIKLSAAGVNSYNVAFGIVPHINSCGRMSHAGIGVELLTCGESEKAAEIANKMAQLNSERKAAQEKIYNEAVKWVESLDSIPAFIVYYAGSAHEGVTGIVAGKLKERFYRPVLIFTDSSDEMVKGTGRSVPGVDLHALLSKYRNMFVRFGGHAGACGLTMHSGFLNDLREWLNNDVERLVESEPELLVFRLVPDAVINADEVTLELAGDIRCMEPFGEGNPRPLFKVEDITVRSVRSMGADGQYKKLLCVSDGGRTFDAVCFDTDIENIEYARPGAQLTIIGEIDENIWKGRHSVQLMVKGIYIQNCLF